MKNYLFIIVSVLVVSQPLLLSNHLYGERKKPSASKEYANNMISKVYLPIKEKNFKKISQLEIYGEDEEFYIISKDANEQISEAKYEQIKDLYLNYTNALYQYGNLLSAAKKLEKNYITKQKDLDSLKKKLAKDSKNTLSEKDKWIIGGTIGGFFALGSLIGGIGLAIQSGR